MGCPRAAAAVSKCVVQAWSIWSSAAEAALADAYQFSGCLSLMEVLSWVEVPS